MTRKVRPRIRALALMAAMLGLGLSDPSLAQQVRDPTDGVLYVKRPPTTYAEVTVAVVANTWTLAISANALRIKLILGDATGLGCAYSFVASPVSGEGTPFSLSGTPGSYPIDDPTPTNAVYVRCTLSGTITVATA